MLTNDKNITTPEYWEKVYTGQNDNAKVDASNTVRPKNAFDRFGWAAAQVEGPNVLGVASGHAHIEKRIKGKHPLWNVVASDQTEAAAEVAHFTEYVICSAYNIPFPKKTFDTVVIAQALEYLEYEDLFLEEASRVAKKIVLTAPKGIMQRWSQLRIYDEAYLKNLITRFAEIERIDTVSDLILIKAAFL